jgi:ribose 5-phosphate isomerase B
MTLTIALAADHGGFELKQSLLSWLHNEGYKVIDYGAADYDANDDYPDFAEILAQEILQERADRGILVCGSGIGASIVANKLPGIRAGLCHDTYSAHQGVEHDDMNILCIGARVIGIELAKEVISIFLSATFAGDERFCRRLNKLASVEERVLKGYYTKSKT